MSVFNSKVAMVQLFIIIWRENYTKDKGIF